MEPVPLLTVSFLSRVSLGNRWTTRDSTVMSKCTYIWSILDKMFIYSTVLNRREYIYDQNTFSDWYNSDEFIWKFLITKIEYLSNTRSIVARYGKQTEHLIIRFSGYLLTLMVGRPRVRRPFVYSYWQRRGKKNRRTTSFPNRGETFRGFEPLTNGRP